MNIDLGSFAFGSSLKSGGGTPSWGTALGQSSPDYKFSYPGCEAILIGMVYCSVPLDNVRLPIGKGGRIYVASSRNECQIASLFRKVFINGIKIDYPFIMVLMKEESDSHPGRKGIKYSDKIEYEDNTYHYSNQEFINRARLTLNMDEGACWFVYKIEVHNQDELHLFAVIVDSEDNVVYENSSKRRNSWLKLIPDVENEPKFFSSDTSFEDNNILQQIYYGTPGSGKSHKVKEYLESVYPDEKEREAFVFRTTFHPDSDYASFVGCYKPKMDGDNIKYEFTPQAFTEAYVKAWQETEKQVHLVIEEINRGNCAQIFGDLFQLLDRKGGVSEYPINADADLKQYLEKELGADNEGIANGKLKLPANLNILATMNTSDQSLFPMDSAFKRRWSWECVPIDYTNAVSGNFTITIDGKPYNWHKFLKAVNEKIVSATDSEDKQMGNFFINGDVDERQFVDKVMFYLWNDICKEEFHTKNNFFRNYVDDKKTEKEFSFNELFGPNATALLKGFMEFLEVSPNVEESQNVEEEIATDSESA